MFSDRCSHNEIYDSGTEILLLTKNDHYSTQKAPKSIIPQEIKSAGHSPSSGSVETRFEAIFKKRPSWIRRCCFSWNFAPGGRLNHEAYNVRTIVFMISKNTIPYIGTEILYETCDGHNSTQNAPKSMIPGRIKKPERATNPKRIKYKNTFVFKCPSRRKISRETGLLIRISITRFYYVFQSMQEIMPKDATRFTDQFLIE